MHPGPAVLAAGVLGIAACTHEPAAVVQERPQARDFAAIATRLDKLDPDSPEALNARLAYVDSLTDEQAPAASCEQRLDAAQTQLDRVAASRAMQVMFPEGWARATQAEYQVHSERAACARDTESRDRELTLALEAARTAADQYRESFDYKSMVVMQFNAAATLHARGEDGAALRALEATLALDREYGLRQDAEENYRTLRDWRHEPEDPAQLSAWLGDFPTRSVTLKFGWSAREATVSTRDARAWLVHRRVLHSRGAATATRHIQATPAGWSISYESASSLDPGVWPLETGDLKDMFTPALLQLPGLDIDAAGNLRAVLDPAGFAAQFAAATVTAIGARAPAGTTAGRSLRDTASIMQVLFAPGVLESKAAEAYRLETAMWIGATLEQGEWYQLAAPLSVPGLQRVVVNHLLEFTYARSVACAAGGEHTCAEIIVRATPQDESLAAALQDLGLTAEHGFRYVSSTYLRLVVDPQTLLPQLRETRQYWYVLRPGGEIRLESEHVVSTTSYR